MLSALSGPADWILRYVKTYLYLFRIPPRFRANKAQVFGFFHKPKPCAFRKMEWNYLF